MWRHLHPLHSSIASTQMTMVILTPVIFCSTEQPEEDEDLELALMLSLQEHQASHSSQDSKPQQSQRQSDQLASLSKSQRRNHVQGVGGETGPWGKVILPQTTQETKHQKTYEDDEGTSQTVSRPSTSIPEQHLVRVGDQLTEEGDLNQSEKPKRLKSRRQRRKGGVQQIVGLARSPSAAPPVLLWFRRDLRLCDNPALIGALEAGAPVIPVFIWSPEEEEGPGVSVAMGGACTSDWC